MRLLSKAYFRRMVNFTLAAILVGGLINIGPATTDTNALTLINYKLTATPGTQTIESGTGIGTVRVFAESKAIVGGWNDFYSLLGSSAINASVVGAEVSLDGVSWVNTLTVPIAQLRQVTTILSVRSAIVGNHMVNFSAQIPTVSGVKNLSTSANIAVVDTTAPGVPSLESPANNAIINYNNFLFNWSDVTDAVSYEAQFSQSNSVDSNGVLNSGVWSGDASHNQPIISQAWSSGANGTWYWQVRAVDASGNKSAWTAPWKMTIDMAAPAVPTNLAWANADGVIASGGATNLYSGVASWDASDSDTVRYIYRYWNDIATSPYGVSSPWENSSITGLTAPGVFNQGEGTHYFSVAAVDHAGNVSAFSVPFVIRYDATLPVITVVGGDLTVEAGSTYTEKNATWTDVVDGSGIVTDIAGDVVDSSQPGVYLLVYTYTDAAGNVGIGTRTVTVVDTTAPVVSIVGNDVELTVGDTYIEQGATWTDAVDVSGTVSLISGTVNTQVSGEYTITYTYTDAAGNTGTATRKVTVSAVQVQIPVARLGNAPAQPAESNGANLTPVAETIATNTTNDGGRGTTDTKAADTTAWLWWVIGALAALGLASWFFVAWRRRRKEQEK